MGGSINGGVSLDELTADAVNFDGSTFTDGSTPDFIPSGDNVRDAILNVNNTAETADGLAQVGRFAIVLTYNASISDGTFIGYSNLINGLDTPIIVPKNSTLQDLTFSNSRSNADYSLVLRRNSSTATPFLTITKTNTQSFTENDIGESFNGGDSIFIEYLDNGNNANDAGIVLFFRNET